MAFGPFAAIRAQHAGAEITLLTTPPFAGLARASPWFDRVVVDSRPAWWDLRGLVRLRRALRGFDFVYDLQTSGAVQPLLPLAGRPGWSGIARGASHPHATPGATRCIRWTGSATSSRRPGSPRSRRRTCLADRRPARSLAALCAAGPRRRRRTGRKALAGGAVRAVAPLLQAAGYAAGGGRGGRRMPALAATICGECPAALDLTGQTRMADLAGSRRGRGGDRQRYRADAPRRRGRDAAASCCSPASDPALTRPRGRVTVLREPDLADLRWKGLPQRPWRGAIRGCPRKENPVRCPPSPCPTAPFAASTHR